MAIIRFTCDSATLYAPTLKGALVTDIYDPGKQVGALGKFAGEAGDSTDADLDAYLAARLETEARDLGAGGGPLMFLVHGFLFNPKDEPHDRPKPTNNPHAWIYHFDAGSTIEESWGHNTGWAGRLGFSDTATDHGFSGLPIAFGWFSAPEFNVSLKDINENFYAKACGFADISAMPFLRLLSRVADRLPNKLDIFAHSMGTQLTITALLKAPDKLLRRIGTVVLVGGSAYAEAGAALAKRLDALDAGAQVFNIVNRTDWVLENLARHFSPKPGTNPVIGHDGLGQRFESWMSLCLDDKELQRWAGLMVDPTAYALIARMPDGQLFNMKANHWAYYAHDGNMKFFAHLFRHRKLLSIAALRTRQQPVPELI